MKVFLIIVKFHKLIENYDPDLRPPELDICLKH